jgi:hypothetical protein
VARHVVVPTMPCQQLSAAETLRLPTSPAVCRPRAGWALPCAPPSSAQPVGAPSALMYNAPEEEIDVIIAPTCVQLQAAPFAFLSLDSLARLSARFVCSHRRPSGHGGQGRWCARAPTPRPRFPCHSTPTHGQSPSGWGARASGSSGASWEPTPSPFATLRPRPRFLVCSGDRLTRARCAARCAQTRPSTRRMPRSTRSTRSGRRTHRSSTTRS